jgi:hypothetical protein
MKSKLMTMICAGTLALGALAPSSMAKVGGTLPPVNKGKAVSMVSKTAATKAAAESSKKATSNTNGRSRAISSHSAAPPHVILDGAKQNPF